MRKVTFGGAPSLDGYFARKNDAVDWLMWSSEAARMMSDFWKTVDTVVMGRKTYEVGQKMTKGKDDPYSGMKVYVFSRTLKARKEGSVEIVSTDPVKFVSQLKAQRGKDICVMGGGEFANCLFQGGVIDEIGFSIHPVLLGSGIPLFHEMKRQIDLELLECKPFKNGCVSVKYRVKCAKGKRTKK
jgi:dihydrofolate reductase